MTTISAIDINCDMGESFGNWVMGRDDEMFPLITTANIACGFHAGDPTVMRRTVRAAKEHGIAVGAHPGYHDLEGFGRRRILLSPDEVAALLTYQIGALRAFLDTEDMPMHHVKPHGALYSYLRDDEAAGLAGARAVHALMPDTLVYWPAPAFGTVFCDELQQLGHTVVGDLYPDLSYDGNGTLVIKRKITGTDMDFALGQVKQFLKTGQVQTEDGTLVDMTAGSICVHGDGDHAVELAAAVRQTVLDSGVTVEAVAA
ncbi:5-oxoprolinase subunit PxpA [Streptomyces sp. NPDC004542]|uniref:5-oxoprolinase subunit PxpA n=1 Tax=Streptomyces sp. NPDC004542 TaxID=3154281 RepID=UPI0033BAADE8